MHADVVIIGAGVHGTSLAFHLAKYGRQKIVVIERSHLAAGASGKSEGLVRTNYTTTEEVQLTLESLQYFRHWDELVGGSCGFQPLGFLCFSHEQTQEEVLWRQRLGVTTSLISAQEAKELDPSLSIEDVTQVLYEPESGFADPNETVFGFARAASHLGVELLQETTVTRLLVKGDRVSGVETTKGIIEAPTVVVAAGAWVNDLLHPVGIELGLSTKRARLSVFRWPYERSKKHLIYIDRVNVFSARPIDGNCTLVGIGANLPPEEHPFSYPETVDQDYLEQCRLRLAKRFPVMKRCTTRGNWACVLAYSPDDKPIIGALTYEGLYCIGDSGTSFKFGPAIGKHLAALIMTGTSTVDLSPFRAFRFP